MSTDSEVRTHCLLELVWATGALGILAILALAILLLLAVYFFAAPGREISFWGLKFVKRRINPKYLLRFWPIPRELPEDWNGVLMAFSDRDSNLVSEKRMFEYTSARHDMSEMRTRLACQEMETKGLLEGFGGYYQATDRAAPLIVDLQKEN